MARAAGITSLANLEKEGGQHTLQDTAPHEPKWSSAIAARSIERNVDEEAGAG